MAAQIVVPVGGQERDKATIEVPRATALAAASADARDRNIGILAGIIAIVLGALLIVGAATSGASTWELKVGALTMTLTTGVPGVIFAVIGFLIIWVTQPKVITQAG